LKIFKPFYFRFPRKWVFEGGSRGVINLNIIKVTSNRYIAYVKELFMEYANSLGFDLSFQNFDQELSELPGNYAYPNGTLLLAVFQEKPVGCVALRKIDEEICEVKRLYVKDKYRGKKIGKSLLNEIVKEATKIGYKYMRLDSLSTMKEAIKLYESTGFKEIEPYRYNPLDGAVYMQLELTDSKK